MSSGVSLAAVSHAATVSGTVKGPDGAPFKGAFVIAQNTANRISVSVLSNKDGHYEIPIFPRQPTMCASAPLATKLIRTAT